MFSSRQAHSYRIKSPVPHLVRFSANASISTNQGNLPQDSLIFSTSVQPPNFDDRRLGWKMLASVARHSLVVFMFFLSVPLAGLYAAEQSHDQNISAQQSQLNAIVNERIDTAIGFLVENTDKSVLGRGNLGLEYSLGCLFTNRNIDKANSLILADIEKHPIVREARIPPEGYPAIEFHIYLTPECQSRLTPEVKAAIEKRAWDWALFRSRISTIDRSFGRWEGGFNCRMSEWNLVGSENHQAEWTATNIAALAILRQAGAPYGPQAKLGDGYTVEEHYNGWVDYWTRYFRSRAREGLDCEVAHPSSYGKATLRAYYSVRDSSPPPLKQLASDFLDLYWANVAAEFEPRTGIRSACAATRCYKNTWQQLGSQFWAGPLLQAYNWWTPAKGNESRNAVPQLDMMCLYTSPYRPPALLQKIASDMNRPPYQATSRRFGRGVGAANIDRMIVFDDGKENNSYIRRDVYYTPDYTISAITFDPARSYIESTRQARVMGVTFSKEVNARILIYGEVGAGKALKDAETEHKQVSSAAVNGLCGPGVLIGGCDPGAAKADGVRLFISKNLWENRSEGADDWLFTQLGDAYGAIRIATGGYKVKPAPNETGVFLQLNEKWAPIIVQMGRMADYKDFDAFKNAVQATKVSYTDDKLTWVSLAGDHYDFWTKDTHIPQVNGTPLDLNPRKTYDMPFVSMEHGSDVATISYPGWKPLVLDFSKTPEQ